ncbi:MAG: CPBP family intramembrane metalloprotease [Anaerolineae bacterium]|nr:CPBP family intramembrane metalloprotease [Anaerolineae bacterium]
MTRRQSSTNRTSSSRPGTKRKSSSSVKAAGFRLDPYFACLIFAGAGLGTWTLPTCVRLAILWTMLLLLWLVYREGQSIRLRYEFAELGRGGGLGLAICLPLLALTYRQLMVAVPILYVGVSIPSGVVPSTESLVVNEADVLGAFMFVSLVLVAPLAEGLFFRNILHRELGFVVSAGFYAIANAILFLPSADGFWVVLLAVCGVATVLGIVYGFLYERYGLATSIVCHMTANLVLLFVPVVLRIVL